MADNTNAQAIRVANEKVRPCSDKILQVYFFMKTMQAEYAAQNWAALFPTGDPTGEIIDGARQDGRSVITNADVNNVITALGAFITHIEASTNQQRDRYLKVAVNPE
jgi:hypothetical protein